MGSHAWLAGAGMADEMELVEEEEEEESGSDEEAEGGAMVRLLFGNVDRNMRVDAAYMDEEALEHLGALGSKQLGGALGQLEVGPGSGIGVRVCNTLSKEAHLALVILAVHLYCSVSIERSRSRSMLRSSS